MSYTVSALTASSVPNHIEFRCLFNTDSLATKYI